MSNFFTCVNQAVHKGHITKSAGDDLKDFYTSEVNAGKADNAETAKAAIKKMQYDKIRAKNLTLMNAKRKEELTKLIESHPEGLHEGLKSLITKNITEGAGYSNIEYRAKVLNDMASQELTDAFDALREQWGMAWWTRDKDLADDVVREIFGQSTGNAQAQKFAGQWNNVAEGQRTQFNAAGGDIQKRSNWNIPQSHDQFKVAASTPDKWKSDIKDLLDYEAMGLKGKSDDEVNALLDYAYESISTGGLNKLEPGKIPKGISSSLAKRGQQHRVLQFKDADSYIKYSEKYGTKDIYTVMSDHIRGTSNDIASIEIMGTNPQHMFDYLQDYVKKNDPKFQKSWELSGYMQSMFDVATGKVDGVYNGTKANIKSAQIFGGFRALNVAGKLGSAAVSSVTDMGMVISTARYNGLNSTKIIADAFKNMGAQDRMKVGAKIGHGMNSWNGTAASRFSEVGGTTAFLDSAADKVLRASGLSLWTEGFRKAFSMEFSSFLADNFDTAFKDLPEGLSRNMQRYGIGEKEWDNIRKSKPVTADNVNYLDPQEIMNMPHLPKDESRELAIKTMEMIRSETDMAVIEPDARVRALTTAGGQRGTLKGELTRTATQFKSFPMAVMFTHLKRGMAQGGWKGKTAYLMPFMMMSTGLGALAVQGKEATKGREPLPMDTGKFWGAAFMQGGGLGLFGDFFFSDQNRFGSSAVESMVGPLGTMFNDMFNMTVAPFHEAADDTKDVGLTRMANTAKGYIPGNNLWYLRLGLGHMFNEYIANQLDPNYERKLKAREKKRKKEFGNDSWFN